MVNCVNTKPLVLVLIVTVHMVFNGPSRADRTGILGTNITLQFTFNTSIGKNSHYAVYITGQTKIAECLPDKGCSAGNGLELYAENYSVFCLIKNLTLHHSNVYWAILFVDQGINGRSNKVNLTVSEDNRTSLDFPEQGNSTSSEYQPTGSSSLFSYNTVTVLVVSAVVLSAATLPCLVWCLIRARDKQQQQQQQNSNATIQEVAEAPLPAPPLVYSVLDFPKRQTVVEVKPSDTEYAAVSHLPEKRRV